MPSYLSTDIEFVEPVPPHLVPLPDDADDGLIDEEGRTKPTELDAISKGFMATVVSYPPDPPTMVDTKKSKDGTQRKYPVDPDGLTPTTTTVNCDLRMTATATDMSSDAGVQRKIGDPPPMRKSVDPPQGTNLNSLDVDMQVEVVDLPTPKSVDLVMDFILRILAGPRLSLLGQLATLLTLSMEPKHPSKVTTVDSSDDADTQFEIVDPPTPMSAEKPQVTTVNANAKVSVDSDASESKTVKDCRVKTGTVWTRRTVWTRQPVAQCSENAEVEVFRQFQVLEPPAKRHCTYPHLTKPHLINTFGVSADNQLPSDGDKSMPHALSHEQHIAQGLSFDDDL